MKKLGFLINCIAMPRLVLRPAGTPAPTSMWKFVVPPHSYVERSRSLTFFSPIPACSTYTPQTSAYDVDMASLWSEHFYHGPASQLCFHPTKTLLAVASADDRAVHVINFHNSMGDFVVCGVGVAPPGQGGVNGLM